MDRTKATTTAGNAAVTPRQARISEDWLSLWTGMAVFMLSLGVFFGIELLGFGAKVGTWTNLSKAITPVEKKLIAWSLGIGLVLLAVLYCVSRFLPDVPQ